MKEESAGHNAGMEVSSISRYHFEQGWRSLINLWHIVCTCTLNRGNWLLVSQSFHLCFTPYLDNSPQMLDIHIPLVCLQHDWDVDDRQHTTTTVKKPLEHTVESFTDKHRGHSHWPNFHLCFVLRGCPCGCNPADNYYFFLDCFMPGNIMWKMSQKPLNLHIIIVILFCWISDEGEACSACSIQYIVHFMSSD